MRWLIKIWRTSGLNVEIDGRTHCDIDARRADQLVMAAIQTNGDAIIMSETHSMGPHRAAVSRPTFRAYVGGRQLAEADSLMALWEDWGQEFIFDQCNFFSDS